MTFKEIMKQPAIVLCAHPIRVGLILALILASTIYPSNLERDYAVSRGGEQSAFVRGIEDYGRHVNSVVPLGLAIVLRDWVGLKQIAVVTVAGILATHGPKRLLNDVTIAGTRLGQRPYSPDSQHNMPSGHSALAASGALIMGRRYALWLGGLGLIMTLLTMYARVMLDQHTISATLAGALIGALVAWLFVTRFKKDRSKAPAQGDMPTESAAASV